jgi:predicted CopG family antitoxin
MKTIRLKPDTIAALDELRDEEETFHDVVKRLLRETGSEVR